MKEVKRRVSFLSSSISLGSYGVKSLQLEYLDLLSFYLR
jgi:hypothetical protein